MFTTEKAKKLFWQENGTVVNRFSQVVVIILNVTVLIRDTLKDVP